MTILLAAYAEWYNLCSLFSRSVTTTCCTLRAVSVKFQNNYMFWWGKLVATLICLALMEGFLRFLVTNTASWVGSDMLHNPVPWCLSTCLSVQCFCSHAVGFEFWTLSHPPAVLHLSSLPRKSAEEGLGCVFYVSCTVVSSKQWLDTTVYVAVIFHCIIQHAHKWKSSYTKSDHQVYENLSKPLLCK